MADRVCPVLAHVDTRQRNMKQREAVRYSEAFKQQVIGEIAAGKFSGPFAAARAYRIEGARTIQGWLRKYGRGDLMPRRVTITTMAEQDQTQALKQRVRDLEKALADTHMKELLGEAYLEIACKRLGLDVDEFKKKAATTRSEPPKRGQP
jgi:transposase-like protein